MFKRFLDWVRKNTCSCDAYYGMIDEYCPIHYPTTESKGQL